MRLEWLGETPEETIKKLKNQQLEISARVKFKSGVLPGEVVVGKVSHDLRHVLRLAAKVHKITFEQWDVSLAAQSEAKQRHHLGIVVMLENTYHLLMRIFHLGLQKAFGLADEALVGIRRGWYVVVRMNEDRPLFAAPVAG